MINSKVGHLDRILRGFAVVGLMYINLSWNEYVQGSIVLSDMTKESNINFKHTDGSSGNFYS